MRNRATSNELSLHCTLAAILQLRNEAGGLAATLGEIRALTGCSERTTRYHLRALERRKVLRLKHRANTTIERQPGNVLLVRKATSYAIDEEKLKAFQATCPIALRKLYAA